MNAGLLCALLLCVCYTVEGRPPPYRVTLFRHGRSGPTSDTIFFMNFGEMYVNIF